MTVICHAVFRGRVQGVGFRAFVAERALTHGVAGWVRNRSDGTVEAVLSGRPDVVDLMIGECRKGPPGARVDAVYRRDGTQDELALGRAGEIFSVLPTT